MASVESIPYDVGTGTDVGAVREENQDAAGYFQTKDGAWTLLVLCDGMGGHTGGQRAATLALEAISQGFYQQIRQVDPNSALAATVLAAHQRIQQEVVAHPEMKGMGTTCVVLAASGRWVHLAHVGDSRIYRIRPGTIERVTRDHTAVQRMIDGGLLTEEEGATHPDANVLSQCVGAGDQVVPEVQGPWAFEPGDRYLLCSDGLHGFVEDAEIGAMAAAYSAQEAVERLIALTIERQGSDNVSVQILHRSDGAPPTGIYAPEMFERLNAPAPAGAVDGTPAASAAGSSSEFEASGETAAPVLPADDPPPAAAPAGLGHAARTATMEIDHLGESDPGLPADGADRGSGSWKLLVGVLVGALCGALVVLAVVGWWLLRERNRPEDVDVVRPDERGEAVAPVRPQPADRGTPADTDPPRPDEPAVRDHTTPAGVASPPPAGGALEPHDAADQEPAVEGDVPDDEGHGGGTAPADMTAAAGSAASTVAPVEPAEGADGPGGTASGDKPDAAKDPAKEPAKAAGTVRGGGRSGRGRGDEPGVVPPTEPDDASNPLGKSGDTPAPAVDPAEDADPATPAPDGKPADEPAADSTTPAGEAADADDEGASP